jgi:hypothetical protein
MSGVTSKTVFLVKMPGDYGILIRSGYFPLSELLSFNTLIFPTPCKKY